MFSTETLQFEKLLELIAHNTQTPMGQDFVLGIRPLSNRLELKRDLSMIEEAIAIKQEEVVWNFSELLEPSNAIALLKIKNSSVEPTILRELARLLSQALFAKNEIRKEKQIAPTIWQIVETLPKELGELAAKINKKILPSGEIDDSASRELNRIRREINSQRVKLTRSLEGLMRSNSSAIQDEIVTVRNERFVIPVKSDFSGKINGVAHGASSSGATIFIEPLESIEANNELQKLKAKEENEIARILFSLAEELREQLPSIEQAVDAVAELDFVKAKMIFAERFNAIVPTISEDETLDLVEARHPVLEENIRTAEAQRRGEKKLGQREATAVGSNKQAETRPRGSVDDVIIQRNNHPDAEASPLLWKEGSQSQKPGNQSQKPGSQSQKLGSEKDEIVPVSFSLSAKNAVMIISGANAGGKTVVLKTAGLLSLMAVSGLPIPAKQAKIPFYASVLADIGDNQSLSANLSTFSSHISNIASMMRTLQTPALVLLDEVGTGTDPEEGSALGVAIVDHFRNHGAQVIASTHYKGLKIYATNDEDVINASVEFNEKTLEPTYKLLTGMAGASSGLEIARRFGIKDKIVDAARKNLDSAAREAEDYLHRLQSETKQAEDLRIALEEEREATAEKYARLDIEFRKKEKARRKEFDSELSSTISSFERKSKDFIKTVEDKKERKRLEKQLATNKAELKRQAFEVETKRQEKPVAENKNDEIQVEDRPIEVGLDVLLKRFGTIGKVEKISGKNVDVMVGSMRMRQKAEDLQVVSVGKKKGKKSLEKLQKAAAGSNIDIELKGIQSELNLIGQTTMDAETEVDQFLDDSYVSSLKTVRIIHGFGTGALKNSVHQSLKGHPHVSSFGFAPQNEGGQGATIVELKQ